LEIHFCFVSYAVETKTPREKGNKQIISLLSYKDLLEYREEFLRCCLRSIKDEDLLFNINLDDKSEID